MRNISFNRAPRQQLHSRLNLREQKGCNIGGKTLRSNVPWGSFILLNCMPVCAELFCLYPSHVHRRPRVILGPTEDTPYSFIVISDACHSQMSQDGSAKECVMFFVCNSTPDMQGCLTVHKPLSGHIKSCL